MTEQCARCAAKILARTFQRTGGLCQPCRNRQRRAEIGETAFGVAYDAYFHRTRLGSAKYSDCWDRLELAIAGPLWAARDCGDVSYIFKTARIDGVTNFDDLVAWTRSRIRSFRECVHGHQASTVLEANDRDALLARASDLEALVAMWPALEKSFGRGAA